MGCWWRVFRERVIAHPRNVLVEDDDVYILLNVWIKAEPPPLTFKLPSWIQ